MNSETHTQDGAPIKTTIEARQGVTGHNVRYVLFWSLAGVIAVFAIAWFGFVAH